MELSWAERRSEVVDRLLVETEMREIKECACGELLTNDEIGENCPACRLSAEDMILLATSPNGFIYGSTSEPTH